MVEQARRDDARWTGCRLDRPAGPGGDLANGQRFTFSKLVLATGSQPVRLPKPGMDLQNVLTFRDLADVGAMRALMRPGARAAVIGGGLLGIAAAYGLAKAGVKVTLVHLMDITKSTALKQRAHNIRRQIGQLNEGGYTKSLKV